MVFTSSCLVRVLLDDCMYSPVDSFPKVNLGNLLLHVFVAFDLHEDIVTQYCAFTVLRASMTCKQPRTNAQYLVYNESGV